MRRVLGPVAWVVLLSAAAGLLVVNVLAWSGVIVDDPSDASSPPEERALAPPAPPAPEPQTVATATSPKPTAPPAKTALTISATRGDCWVEVRAGSSAGQVLYAGLLATGSTIRFARHKLWLRLGASSNVDVVVNGQPSEVPPGTVELVLPARV